MTDCSAALERPEDQPTTPFGAVVAWSIRNRTRLLLVTILLVGAALRVPGIFRDLPFTYYGDEAHLIKRSMAIAAGDLNPHWFNKPAFFMYLLAFAYGVMYLFGAATGQVHSPEQFASNYLENPHAFILVGRGLVCATGIATIYLVFVAARRIFRNDNAALGAATLTAVLTPLVIASQQLKADVPCAFLIMASYCLYLRARESGKTRQLCVAALIGGVAIGTKYYGIVLVPAFAVGELLGGIEGKRPWKETIGRIALVPLLFGLGFFIVSPYHFLDPTWGAKIGRSIRAYVDPAAQIIAYDPDSEATYKTGPSSLFGAIAHFARKCVMPNAVGIVPTLLMLLGAAIALWKRATRRMALVPLTAVATFVMFAVTLSAFHANARHLTAILPLLCLFAFPLGALPRSRVAVGIVAALLVISVGIEIPRSIAHDRISLREDSRNVARQWILDHIPDEARLLLDDYGPQLSPNAAAVARLRERLASLPPDEAFTAHQGILLSILEGHPPRHGKNLDALGHPWWLEREPTDKQILSDRANREASNPLLPRVPKSVSEYRRLGYRFIVTNSSARDRYFDGPDKVERYPTWVAFYEALDKLDPIKVFDPSNWGGKGPVVWIYRFDSGKTDPPR